MDISSVIKSHGLKQQDVADRMFAASENPKTRLASLRNIIKPNANPTIGSLRKLADVIGCSIVELIGETDSVAPNNYNSFVCPKCGATLKVETE